MFRILDCINGTGRICDRTEIRPYRPSVYTRTTGPDELESPDQDELANRKK